MSFKANGENVHRSCALWKGTLQFQTESFKLSMKVLIVGQTYAGQTKILTRVLSFFKFFAEINRAISLPDLIHSRPVAVIFFLIVSRQFNAQTLSGRFWPA